MKDLFFDLQSKRRALRKALLYLIEVWADIIRFQRKTLSLEIYIEELGKRFPELSADVLLSVKTSIGSFSEMADSTFLGNDDIEDKLFTETLLKIAEDDPLLAFELEAQVFALDYLTVLHNNYKEMLHDTDWSKISELLKLITSADFKDNINGLEKNILLVAGKIGFITKIKTRKLLTDNFNIPDDQIKNNIDKIIESVATALKVKNDA
ncbi:hypothetical protein CH352_18845 [Leptospira hartskeerlii]|uniref:Uncharacterized protein n=1 Tax=Leptospira hartskeerlii TaxID=2023177 RepID=A0A2M9X877_9LEPT|nr:hypothetical protein [Leptospira hartskeerlii]PJZ23903.1 hypothetical protein CH357_18780 [Leptospira hartskeerlii]PJZ31925.1 hypothetical protein CH352_18845 [Leptospira hartskeerlii]